MNLQAKAERLTEIARNARGDRAARSAAQKAIGEAQKARKEAEEAQQRADTMERLCRFLHDLFSEGIIRSEMPLQAGRWSDPAAGHFLVGAAEGARARYVNVTTQASTLAESNLARSRRLQTNPGSGLPSPPGGDNGLISRSSSLKIEPPKAAASERESPRRAKSPKSEASVASSEGDQPGNPLEELLSRLQFDSPRFPEFPPAVSSQASSIRSFEIELSNTSTTMAPSFKDPPGLAADVLERRGGSSEIQPAFSTEYQASGSEASLTLQASRGVAQRESSQRASHWGYTQLATIQSADDLRTLQTAASLGDIPALRGRRQAVESLDDWSEDQSSAPPLRSGHPESGLPESGHPESGHPESGHPETEHALLEQMSAADVAALRQRLQPSSLEFFMKARLPGSTALDPISRQELTAPTPAHPNLAPSASAGTSTSSPTARPGTGHDEFRKLALRNSAANSASGAKSAAQESASGASVAAPGSPADLNMGSGQAASLKTSRHGSSSSGGSLGSKSSSPRSEGSLGSKSSSPSHTPRSGGSGGGNMGGNGGNSGSPRSGVRAPAGQETYRKETDRGKQIAGSSGAVNPWFSTSASRGAGSAPSTTPNEAKGPRGSPRSPRGEGRGQVKTRVQLQEMAMKAHPETALPVSPARSPTQLSPRSPAGGSARRPPTRPGSAARSLYQTSAEASMGPGATGESPDRPLLPGQSKSSSGSGESPQGASLAPAPVGTRRRLGTGGSSDRSLLPPGTQSMQK